jgi:hypothetical protein
MSGHPRPPARDYESTVMRIAGNLLSGVPFRHLNDEDEKILMARAVTRARAIVAETKRTAEREADPTKAECGVRYIGPHGDYYIGLADGRVAWLAATAIDFDPAAFTKVEE